MRPARRPPRPNLMRPALQRFARAGLLFVVGCAPAATAVPDDLSANRSDSAGPSLDLAVLPDLGPGVSAVMGTVLDETAAPLGGVPVLACTAISCEFGKSGDDGTFFVLVPDDITHMVVKTQEDLSRQPAWAESCAPIWLPGHTTVDAGKLFVSKLPAAVDLQPVLGDPQSVEVGDGLVLTLRRGDLVPPFGAPEGKLAARQIATDRLPALPGLTADQIVAVYALSPFATTSASRIGVRLPTQLAAGTKVQFRVLSDLDGQLQPAVAGVSDGSTVGTAVGDGIEELSWLVVTR